MAVCGIVAEYNPFHSGHAYHIAQSRAVLGAETAVVCVMSGNFVQRGSPAMFLKHARAEAAVRCGADLALELPLPWALSSAERFAFGAVSLLASTGVVTHLSFGSEGGDLAALRRAAALLARSELGPLIREALGRGLPYAAARQAAAEALSGDRLDIMSTPNNILGIEYLKALQTLRAPITPLAIPRLGAEHDGAEAGAGEFPSASALRERLKTGEGVSGAVPAAALEVFERETAAGRGPIFAESLDTALLSRLRALPREDFAALPDMSEGLENRLFRAAREAGSFAEAVALAKTKRYAASRLRRAFLGAALGLRAADASRGAPPYLRVLAANAKGRALLARMREAAALPVLTKPAAARELNEKARRVFDLEAGAADLYALALPAAEERRGGAEWRTGPVIVE